jgi:hypothetical protein
MGRYGSTFEDRWLYLKLFSIDIRVILKVKSVGEHDFADYLISLEFSNEQTGQVALMSK